ncbi:MAG: hypothetical protein AB1758_08140 [Candidatus Eremiobacterota bacterium]
MSSSSRRRRGTSLAEIILTSALVLLVIGLVATLVREYRRVSTHTRFQDASLRSAMALRLVREELKEAVEVLQPPDGSGGIFSVVEFDRLDPDTTTRVPGAWGPGTGLRGAPGPWPTPTPSPPAVWDPRDPADLIRVRYAVSNRQLLRTVTGPGAQTQLMAENVNGFSAQNQGNDAVRLTLRVQEEQREAIYSLFGVLTP